MVEGLPPSPLTSAERVFVHSCVDVIVRLATIFGFDNQGYRLAGTYNHWIYCASVAGDPIKFVKWKIAAFYSAWKDQLVNDDLHLIALGLDNPKILLGGRGYAFLNKVLRRTDPRAWETFITSVLYSKKGMPRPPKHVIRQAEKKTFKTLVSFIDIPNGHVLRGDWALGIPTVLATKDNMITQIRRTVKELFAGETMTMDDYLEPFFPSTSSNYIRSRSMAGAVGAILEDSELMKDLRVAESLIDCSTTVRIGRKRKSMHVTADDSRLRRHWDILFNRLCEKAREEEAIATPLGLPEALKVRVITKGPPYLYTVLKPLQRKLWKILKQNPFLSLIGSPVSADFIQERLGAKLAKGEKFLSVDYSDATNQMQSYVSEEIANAICDEMGLNDLIRGFFLRSLTGHTIEDSETGEKGLQKSGQLMGSITSFPILCIANAVILRWTRESVTGHSYALRNVPGCVNGDDGLLRVGPNGPAHWMKIASIAGLLPSIGKVYYSESFLNINSTTYNYHPDGYEGYTTIVYDRLPYPGRAAECAKSGVSDQVEVKESSREVRRLRHFQLVPYVNMGLLLGLKRSGAPMSVGDTGPDGKSIGAVSHALIDTCPEYLKENVLRFYINHNKKIFQRFPLPWFIPERFGGLGLPVLGRFFPRDMDLRLARYMHVHPETFRVPTTSTAKGWQMWRLATKLAPSFATACVVDVPTGFNSEDPSFRVLSRKQLISRYVLDCLFRFEISELLKIADYNQKPDNTIRKKSQMWAKALRAAKSRLPEPFRMDNLPPSVDEDDFPFIFLHIDKPLVSFKIHVALDASVMTETSGRFPYV